ncbi:hypothetical protein [Vibrio vulnificus]|uniref:hypothetical protein n=1 Tax=Vibrio vulnificus TaxID=672 RepID=UPI00324299FA|nr:hypothetical protein [Vibrio parahaemolyticus]
MCLKNRYIINEQALKAYALGDIEFKSNTLYTTFKHSELKQLPDHVRAIIESDLSTQDYLRVETLPDARERALYSIVSL